MQGEIMEEQESEIKQAERRILNNLNIARKHQYLLSAFSILAGFALGYAVCLITL